MKSIIQQIKFNYCPKCGRETLEPLGPKGMYCSHCDYTYFHNTASSVGAIIRVDSKIILVKRAHEPKRGLYDLPGGFVDYGESIEKALIREVNEELGVELREISYFGSFPNIYIYKGVTYYTTDAIFTGTVTSTEFKLSDEITTVELIDISKIDPSLIAFDSLRNAVVQFASSEGVTI